MSMIASVNDYAQNGHFPFLSIKNYFTLILNIKHIIILKMSLNTELVKVGCYNILADGWLDACKPIFLGCWEKRKLELVKRIDDLGLDVVCLQEVDRFNDLAHIMWDKGYTGYRVDGKDVAVFFRTERFKVLKKEELHYKDHLWRSALLLQLQSTKSNSTFNIISTHVTWIKNFDLEQMQQLQTFVEERRSTPTIVCGDLNATPDWIGIKTLCSIGFHDALRHSSKKTYIDESRRLDYILVPDAMHVKQADVNGISSKLKTKEEPSDHLPITATVLIPSALQTINKERPNTLEYSLFESFNEEMTLQAFSQDDYNEIARLFQSALECARTKDDPCLLNPLLKGLVEPKYDLVRAIFKRAIQRHERHILNKQISFLQKEQKDDALYLNSQISLETKQAVYFAIYEIEKRNGKNISHPNFGEAAFHSFDNLDTTNTIRIQAIERYLLRQVLALFNQGLEHEAMPLFEGLSEDSIRNSVYGETYFISQSKGLITEHSDFGKVAFHSVDANDIPNEVRVAAIKSYLSKTSV